MDTHDKSEEPKKPEQTDINPTEETEQITDLSTPEIKKPKKAHVTNKKHLIILVIIALLVAIGMFVLAQKLNDLETTTTSNKTQEEVEQPLDPAELAAALERFKNPTTGETWLPEPKKIAPQNLFDRKDVDPDQGEPIEYYEVGKRGDSTIIMSVEHMLGDAILLFERDTKGDYKAISRFDSQFDYDGEDGFGDEAAAYEDIYNDKVVLDKETKYDSLSIPKELTLKNGEKLSRYSWASLGTFKRPDLGDDAKLTTQEQLGGSTLYKATWTYSDTKLTGISYRIDLPIGTYVELDYRPLDTEAKNYKWNNAEGGVNSTYAGIMRGCGTGSGSVSRADNLKDSDFVLIGKSGSGQDIYGLKNSNYEIIDKAYDEFMEFNDYEESEFKNYKKEQFIKDRALIAYKNASGEWLVYTRDDRGPQGGCAKPVVYLYPTEAREVKVKVGADVKVSDPYYNPNTGWSAWAEPSGRLTVDGINHDYLFWEGPGWGRYPVIDSGTIVKRSEAAPTMRSQLRQQGLNNKEIADFMEYWEEHIPNQAYVRLSWLTNQEIDRLAPLQVLPKPDTVQRVFLDMEGLDKPMSIPGQKLTSFERRGFTVVEWGGLARVKLY